MTLLAEKEVFLVVGAGIRCFYDICLPFSFAWGIGSFKNVLGWQKTQIWGPRVRGPAEWKTWGVKYMGSGGKHRV